MRLVVYGAGRHAHLLLLQGRTAGSEDEFCRRSRIRPVFGCDARRSMALDVNQSTVVDVD